MILIQLENPADWTRISLNAPGSFLAGHFYWKMYTSGQPEVAKRERKKHAQGSVLNPGLSKWVCINSHPFILAITLEAAERWRSLSGDSWIQRPGGGEEDTVSLSWLLGRLFQAQQYQILMHGTKCGKSSKHLCRVALVVKGTLWSQKPKTLCSYLF